MKQYITPVVYVVGSAAATIQTGLLCGDDGISRPDPCATLASRLEEE